MVLENIFENEVINVKNIIKKMEDKKEFYKLIDSLEKTNEVYFDERNMLLYPLGNKYFIAEVNKSKRGNMNIVHGGNVYNLNDTDTLLGDKILYSIENNEFTSVRITERSEKLIVSEIKFSQGKYYLSHYNAKIDFPIELVDIDNYSIGDIVKINIGIDKIGGCYEANVVDYVCNVNDVDSEFKRVCSAYGFTYDFSDEIIEEMKNVEVKVSKKNKTNRIDLRKQQVFTIDGDDAKDKDDAIAIEKLKNGDYILRVSIADVSQYVNPWTNINTYYEAQEKGTSIYIAGSVSPMLPKKLSNGICSLNERVDRLAKTVEMRFDKDANLLKYKIYNSIINSKKAFTYEELNKYYKEGINPSSNLELLPRVDEALELSRKISDNRLYNGAINLFADELKIEVDKNKKITSIKDYEISDANKLIENFMVITNSVVAHYSLENNIPLIYRVHEETDQEDIDFTIKKINKSKLLDDDINTKEDYSKYVTFNDKSINGIITSYFLLRAMKKAHYSTELKGHYGLGLEEYAQFTSPIRRYPDLVNHILIDCHLNKKELPISFLNSLELVSQSSSLRERDADNISREVNNLKIYDYLISEGMKDIPMTICSANKNFVLVKKLGLCEGMVPLDYFDSKVEYDRKKDLIRVGGSKKCYKTGDVLLVTPHSCDSQGIVFKSKLNTDNYKQEVKKKAKGIRISN